MSNIVIPDIIDNSNYKLSEILNSIINEESKVYIATGYFNLEGFNLIKDSLKKAKEVKIILGRALSPEHIATQNQIEMKLQEEIENNIDEGDYINFLDEFIDFLKKSSVEIKIFKDAFFHGKFYVIEGGLSIVDSIAIIGSSNLTYAGLTSNYELNSVIKQDTIVKSHKDYFFQLFNEKSEDYKSTLLSLLENFVNLYPPYDVYMKVLYSSFEDRLAQPSNEEITSPIALANFQRDGYISALKSLEQYGGVILSDSVGLGKTYLALRILDDFAYRLRKKTMIICPAQLREILWEPKLREYGIKADIISQEIISRNFDIEKYKDYELIVIDESHNFRNSNTNRWKNLFQTIISGNNSKKVILITATPVNNSVFDLFNQLRFITKDNDEFFKSAGIHSLWGYFLRSHENKETLYDLLEEIAVRRSRQFIKKHYPNAIIDGNPVRFPERKLYTIKYKLTDVYSGIYKECLESIESLTLASYNIDIFRKEIFTQRVQQFEQIKQILKDKGWSDKDIQGLLMNLGRNEAVIAILKILLLKRLESSIFSFQKSILNLLNFQRRFLELIKKGKFLDRESYRKFYLSASQDDEIEEFIENFVDIDPEKYEINEIILRTEKDIKILENIYGKLESIMNNDIKIKQLVDTISKLKNKKIVIFGYFKDTMRYVYNYITQDIILKMLGIDKQKIAITDSDVKPEERKNIIRRFSPISNGIPEIKGTDKEIQILFSTDVLSEGQNLQDADTIINYDLPWNPVKIVQRVGRLDRIGSPYEFINVYNFFPEDELESLIKLLHRLYDKLDAINKSVGLDSSILGETPNPKDFGYIKDIFDQKNAVLDELEGLSELAVGEFLKDEIIKYLQSEGEKRIMKIPNGIGSAIKRKDKKGVFVAFKDTERNYWCFYDIQNNKIIDNRLECIKIIRCEKDEPAVNLKGEIDPYEIIKKVKNHIISRLKTSQVRPKRLVSPQSHIVNFLQSIGNKGKDLLEYYSNPLPEIYLKELRKMWNLTQNLNNEAILKSLDDFRLQHPNLIEQSDNEEKKEIKLKLIAFMTILPE